MKIVHYFLGFPPYRSGGLTRYALDLMISQKDDGNEVIAIWPGEMQFINKTIRFKKRKKNNGISNYEIINPLPVPLDEGVKNIEQFTKEVDGKVFSKFFEHIKPDVIHIHTLMGLHKEFVESANKKNIKTIFTTHDYFGICPKVTLFKNNNVCVNDHDCNDCIMCNSNALSLNKIRLLQSPIYRLLKENLLIKKIRTKHRNKFFDELENDREKQLEKTFDDYSKLREYYIRILDSIDLIHYNSSVSKKIYEKYISPKKSILLSITHKNIKDCRNILDHNDGCKLRMVYLSPKKASKGFDVIKNGLDDLWNEGYKNFELNLYGDYCKISPYMNVVAEKFDNSKLDKVFKNIDLLLAPSVWYETFGFTVLEALSYNVPVLITENVGAKDIVGTGGIIIKANDVEGFKEEIRKINHKKIKQLKNNIKKINIKSWEDFVKENYNLYLQEEE